MKYLLSLGVVLLLASCWAQNIAEDNSELSKSNISAKDLSINTETSMEDMKGSVVVDLNHPLAGKDLNFEVEIMKITKADASTDADVVESGDSIEVHYVGTLTDGEKFDSSRDRDQTLPFTVGAGQMIAGFDAGVVGMKLGETKNLEIPAAQAYGERDDSRTQTIPKAELASFTAAGFKLEVGESLPTQFGELKIIEVIEE